jgi:histidine triad (HIT) family protein
MVGTGCVFCERAAGRDFWIPVEQTQYSIAAVANHQRSVGSLLVIPRRHVVALHDLSDDEALDLLRTLRAVTAAVERAYGPDGLYVWQGGRIPLAHIHIRLCPRYEGVPYTFLANSKLPLTPLGERREIAGRLSGALRAAPAAPASPPGP